MKTASTDEPVPPTYVTDTKEKQPSKRRRTGETEETCYQLEHVNEPVGDDEPGDDKASQAAKSLAERFKKWLAKSTERGKEGDKEDSDGDGSDGHEGEEEADDGSSDHGGGEDDTDRSFIRKLTDYRQKLQHVDGGKRLEEIFSKEERRVKSKNRQTEWRLWFCRMCVQLLSVYQDPAYSETNDIDAEKKEKYMRKACIMINEILNGLWVIWKRRSLGFYRFLGGTLVRSS